MSDNRCKARSGSNISDSDIKTEYPNRSCSSKRASLFPGDFDSDISQEERRLATSKSISWILARQGYPLVARSRDADVGNRGHPPVEAEGTRLVAPKCREELYVQYFFFL